MRKNKKTLPKTIPIISEIDLKQLHFDLHESLEDELLAEFAINLGENGDLTYELILLDKLISVISSVYPPEENDSDMAPISKELLAIQKKLKPLI